mmetsp:Transcript_11206/g.16734  ORF Transcript_11206/g.16734 Transcript_11206/m.16734 type:complete len:386 (+) Transcript_11206:117-1274(+)
MTSRQCKLLPLHLMMLLTATSTAFQVPSKSILHPHAKQQRQTTTLFSTPPPESPSIPNPLAIIAKSQPSTRPPTDPMVGEDAATFDWSNEKWGKLGSADWLTFSAAVGTILTAVAITWIIPSTGYSDDFLHALNGVTGGNPHLITLAYGIIFPLVHSGLASARPYGEKIVGARMWRVIFAFPSLCLAFSWITYFISHCHDGYTFWDLRGNEAVHTIAWITNFLSFFFLYPTVFNLKEVAAVDQPKIHLWETGIIRITRHPQAVGQTMWSAAHLAMVGTTFTALTMALLVAHHAFACWNGDRRLYDEHGQDFLEIKKRTSVLPFAAILDGRQVLPDDYYKELLRAPYLVIAIGTLGAYVAHPFMQAGSALSMNAGYVEGGIFNGLF